MSVIHSYSVWPLRRVVARSRAQRKVANSVLCEAAEVYIVYAQFVHQLREPLSKSTKEQATRGDYSMTRRD